MTIHSGVSAVSKFLFLRRGSAYRLAAASALSLVLVASCSDGTRPAVAVPPDAGPDATVGVGVGVDVGRTPNETGIWPVEVGQNSEAGGAQIGIDTGKGSTEFISEEPSSGKGGGSAADAGMSAGMGGSSGAGGSTASKDGTPGAAPGGRVAEVEEADIYKLDGNHLFYLNTYRGFLIYDIEDPKNPTQVSRLPVFGYPTEMFVSGTTVYALIRDALYLTEINGKPQFERYNVSQLVAIDISDITNPKVIQTLDIVGQLREGVSRKIENSIYVVSYIPQYYYYGWGYANTTPHNEQAWVYSFDVSNPKAMRKVNELQIFEGGSVQFNDANVSYNKYFSGVAISATSNALMVVENWYIYASSYSASGYGCGSYSNNQRAVVSLIDVSDPSGAIHRHTRFETNGNLSDQFKMTYVYNDQAKTGTFYGVFNRSVWSSSGCMGTSYTQNTLESWDVTDGTNPTKLDQLDFGKANESVRATAFDVDRNVLYGITAQRTDPLYAISIADPKNLSILSAINGLSGDMSVFRLIYNRNFLLAVGTDTSDTCSGFGGTSATWSSNVAVSIIDVRDLTKVRLVQRKCVTVEGADWGTRSDISWNLDQAHKMIGMFSDADANIITVPVNYGVKSDAQDSWWWYRYQSAVGIMTWDLAKYDDTKDETQQSVLQNYGTFVHPNGSVTRTILFTHPKTGRRSMINLSDTHASIADIQDLSKPVQQSIIEIAPYYDEIFRFGDYLVEHVVPKAGDYQSGHEFRVRKGGASLSDPVATFTVGQVQHAVKQGNNLVLFGSIYDKSGLYQSTALVYDLSDPTSPKRGGEVVLTTETFPYYYYYCGWGWWGGYWFQYNNNWTPVDQGLAILSQRWNYGSTYPYTSTVTLTLSFLDLKDPAKPQVVRKDIPALTSNSNYYYGVSSSLVADPMDASGFYLTYRENLGDVNHNGTTFTRYRDYAQHWKASNATLVAGDSVNLPGPLVNTWAASDGTRMFLTRENVYTQMSTTTPYSYYYYKSDTRLALLKQTTANGKVVAELLDGKTFTDTSLSALFREGDTLVVTGQPSSYYYGSSSSSTDWQKTSARLMIFDLTGGSMTTAYDQPTKAYNLQIMGTQKNRAFLNLQGDGIVVLDIAKPTAPTGVSFLRTLGYATHLESFGDDVYVASGYFGLNHLSLKDPPNLPQQP